MYIRIVAGLLMLFHNVHCNEYKGRYTRDIKDYEIVVPRKISKDGKFRSYYLPHFYNPARVKRGVDTGKVHYMVPIDGMDRILELAPAEDFHAPGMVVEHHSKGARFNFNSIKIRKPRPRRCYYHGTVRDDPKSSAAITACSGLAGSIKVGTTQYLIEPVDDEGKPTVDVKHKHLLYKRFFPRTYGNRSKCGTTGSFSAAFKERMEWEDKYGRAVEASMKGYDNHDASTNLHDEDLRKRRFCTTCRPRDMKNCLAPKAPCNQPNPMFIELLMVVGPLISKTVYLTDDIEQFINTVVNIAVKQFQDSTLGTPIVLKLVRIISFESVYEDLDPKGNNPQKILRNFCQWQMHFNPRMEGHPNHHDYAIYLVKIDSCQGAVLGLANMASMCRPDTSCAVVSEQGLLTGNIITHMIGHALGAEHDDSSTTSCAPVEPDGTTNHMGADICGVSSAWSTCSMQCIMQFVKTHAGWCLTDLPTITDLTYPVLLPGQVYSAAEQCRINFEIDTSSCLVGEFCKRLYCMINDKECVSMGDPPAQGTKCGPNLWCFNGKCVHRGSRPGATNGEWSEWSHWSPCTKTCGGGIQTAHRSCDSPAPSKGGKMCPGLWVKNRMCNIGGCPDAGRGFLDEQCKLTNDMPYHGRKHNWIYFNQQVEDLQCAVICINELNEVAVRNPVARDGTFCRPAHKDVCIRGICRPVGCDWEIDSNAKEDACGICHGNGTECRIMQGFFGEHNVKGRIEFLKLPIGTSMVLVRETRPSPCFFFISNSVNHSFYLNSEQADQLFFTGTFSMEGTIGVYQIKGNMERLFIKEPLGVPITLSSVCPQTEGSLGILYQYALPEPNTPASIPTYSWEYLSWDECPFPCGGGAQRATPVCVEAQGGEVEDCYCSQLAKPPDKVRLCNKHPCQAKWWVGPWANCDCFHQEGVTTRVVMCAQLKEVRSTYIIIVAEDQCSQLEKPRTEKPCEPSKERELWDSGAWRKRDLTDMIPYSESAEDYSVYDDIPEAMVNVRKMVHHLDPEKVDDYVYMRKIGMTNKQWKKLNEDSNYVGSPGNRVRMRRQKLPPGEGKYDKDEIINTPMKPNFQTFPYAVPTRQYASEQVRKSRGLHKGVQVVQQPQTTKPTRQQTPTALTTPYKHSDKYFVLKTEGTALSKSATETVTANSSTSSTRVKVTSLGKISTEDTFLQTQAVHSTSPTGTSSLETKTSVIDSTKPHTSSLITLSVPQVKYAPGISPYSQYATEAASIAGSCWRSEIKHPSKKPTCLPSNDAVPEPAEAGPEVDFLNTSNIKIFVVPIMTTMRTIIQNDQEFVLLETLAKWPVADELAVVEHWGDAARRELKLAKDRANMKESKKPQMVQD